MLMYCRFVENKGRVEGPGLLLPQSATTTILSETDQISGIVEADFLHGSLQRDARIGLQLGHQ